MNSDVANIRKLLIGKSCYSYDERLKYICNYISNYDDIYDKIKFHTIENYNDNPILKYLFDTYKNKIEFINTKELNVDLYNRKSFVKENKKDRILLIFDSINIRKYELWVSPGCEDKTYEYTDRFDSCCMKSKIHNIDIIILVSNLNDADKVLRNMFDIMDFNQYKESDDL